MNRHFFEVFNHIHVPSSESVLVVQNTVRKGTKSNVLYCDYLHHQPLGTSVWYWTISFAAHSFAVNIIHRIRPFLTREAAQLLVQALVYNYYYYNYCNSLLAGLPNLCSVSRTPQQDSC